MNANEILDELKYVTKVLNMNTDVDTKPLVEAATMLRQQQAEIKDLKQQVAFLEDWRDTWRPFLKAIMEKVNEK